MKNLILIVILFTSSVGFSQKEFKEVYTSMYSLEKAEWFTCNVVITYNVDANTLFYKFSLDGDEVNLLRVSEFIEGETDSKDGFTAFLAEDLKSGEEIVVQKFNNFKLGVRILFSDGSAIQFVGE